MTAPPPTGSTATPMVADVARTLGGGWRRYLFPALWLVYLGQTVDGVSKHSTGAAAVAGYTIVVVFAFLYLIALNVVWPGRNRLFWYLYTALIGLTVAELFLAHADALAFCVYIAVLMIAARIPWALPLVTLLAVAAALTPRLVHSWGGRIEWNIGLSVLLVAIAMSGFFKIMQSNLDLAAARAEVARLAAENERSRIARDLHDLLGHSLTTITVKAGLARRLAERGDTQRAFTEISEVEQLSRRTLGDVRAAVSAHREVTLAGELATAREVLRAAGVISELPASVAETDPTLSELFGWVMREGVTNVVRHSSADHVTVTLGRDFVEIVDDGRSAGASCPGNGIAGLRERVEAVGGTLTATGNLNGFRLRAEVPVRSRATAALPATSVAAVPAP